MVGNRNLRKIARYFASSNQTGISLLKLGEDVKSSYFVENPDHIIGKLDSCSMYLHTEKRERTGLKCAGSMRDLVERLPLLIDKLTVQKRTKNHSQENAKKADSQNLEIFKSEKSKNMESSKILLREISVMLKRLEAKLA